ncbi:hypothetical protein ILUMI_16624 [Ignelater luminosus]|uniref:Uncharacterized protein n=1 Tax=Ignelater luminosus TaxID=2038154 RepID=A0A8K0CN86_IGNLU|nr:hypothetical protein ILUMI_16624 [Ignelater luminosus]
MTLTRFIKKLKSESGTPSMGYAAPSQLDYKQDGRERDIFKTNPELSTQKPEPTSLAKVIDKYHFTASQIWNVNETGASTVLKSNKIAAKGKRNVGAMTSEERGTNVTMFDPSQGFSPEIVRPYPKAGPSKIGTAITRSRKAAILTDTPEKKTRGTK